MKRCGSLKLPNTIFIGSIPRRIVLEKYYLEDKMKKRQFDGIAISTIFFMALATFFFLVVNAKPTFAEAQKVTVVAHTPIKNTLTIALAEFVKEVNDRSGGRLQCTLYAANTLYKEPEVLEALPKGTVQIAQVNAAFWKGKLPGLEPMVLAGYFDSVDHFLRFWDSYGFDFMDRQYRKLNSRLITDFLYGADRCIVTKKPLKSIKDLEGLKLWVSGTCFPTAIESMGATGIMLPISEVYSAMSRGILQGIYISLSSIYSRKYWEVSKYIWKGPTIPYVFHIVANNTWFEGLSPDLQKIVIEAGRKVSIDSRTALIPQEAEWFQGCLNKGGLVETKWSDSDFEKFRDFIKKCCADVYRADIGDNAVDEMIKAAEKAK